MKNVSVIPEVVKDQRDFATQMAEAKSFFADKKLSESPKYLLEDNPYADKDGLIEFIFGSYNLSNGLRNFSIHFYEK